MAHPTIVGIGASAGGLEAFTRLLRSLQPDTGLAFVLIQHMARDQESLLPELLGRSSPVPVERALDGARIEANRAYVIPPDTTMTVTDGHLRLVPRPAGRRLHLPIDVFLCSLAEVHGPGAIGVILSGAGSDGARGIEAIKEMGGITFAQDHDSAQHPSMPDAAVATGCVDFVVPPEVIATQLVQIGYHLIRARTEPAAATTPEADEDDRISILKLLQKRSGVDFSQYRRGTVDRRILRRMLVHRRSTAAEYLEVVRQNATELDALLDDLLIGVTSFFRDPETFAELASSAFPKLLAARPPDAPLRAWVVGCSGGEETYSLAIALIEFLEEKGIDLPIQMFGTDLSEASLSRARAGVYSASIEENVSPERLRRFFVLEHGRYRVAKHVRDLCVFSRQNVVRDPPFSHLDLVSCRNVLIYFETALQRRVFPIFHYALEAHGLLLLGNAESPGTMSDLFEPLSKAHKIFRRSSAPVRPLNLDFAASPTLVFRNPTGPRRDSSPTSGGRAEVLSSANTLSIQIDQMVLDVVARQAVVINEEFEIVHFRGNVSPYLAFPPGGASLDLRRLARPELAILIRAQVASAIAGDAQIAERSVAFNDGNGVRYAAIEVRQVPAVVGHPRLFAVFFSDAPPPRPASGDLPNPMAEAVGDETAEELTRENLSLRDELAATKALLAEIVEQHGATIEELRSAGEEIQSSNEELQSTNEELETTKEEVQSTNEELTTLNEELQHRNRELSELASDLANVFASTTIPVVMVGRDLRLRRFTPAAGRVFRLIPTDVGREIGDIKPNFTLTNLEQLIRGTIETLGTSEHVIRDEAGVWWSLVIRPYQTVDRRVDGAVLVFTDIDKPKRAEARASDVSEERRHALVTSEEARVAAVEQANQALASRLAERERGHIERNLLLRQMSTAQEEERRHLSRELHDEAGQHLSALALGLKGLSDIAPAGSELGLRANDLRRIAHTLGEEIHRIALRLRPKALDDFGLEAAVSGYVQDWSSRSGIAFEIQVDEGQPRLPPAIESAAYRLVQEALTNVARHSGATSVSVVVERRDGNLRVIVEDDGRGLDARDLSRDPGAGTGLGLLGMRERVAQLNGTMDLESSEGRGTTLFIRIPLDDQDDARTDLRAPSGDA